MEILQFDIVSGDNLSEPWGLDGTAFIMGGGNKDSKDKGGPRVKKARGASASRSGEEEDLLMGVGGSNGAGSGDVPPPPQPEPTLRDLMMIVTDANSKMNHKLDSMTDSLKREMEESRRAMNAQIAAVDKKSDEALTLAKEALAEARKAISSHASSSSAGVASAAGSHGAPSGASTALSGGETAGGGAGSDPRLMIIGGFENFTARDDRIAAFRTTFGFPADDARIEEVFGPAFGNHLKARFRSSELLGRTLRLWSAKESTSKQVVVDGVTVSLWCTKDKPLVSRNCNSRVKTVFDDFEKSFEGLPDLKFVPIYDNSGNGVGEIVCNKVVVLSISDRGQKFDFSKAAAAFTNFFAGDGVEAAWHKKIDEAVALKRSRSSF